MEQAVLAACWDTDGSKIYTGSADKMGKAWDLQTDQNVQFAVHDQVSPLKRVRSDHPLGWLSSGREVPSAPPENWLTINRRSQKCFQSIF